ncbi:pectate lyase [Flammeovirgaceae bacterium SG7u.111]|nr:pectate lyase [Flammeovirgaceae bacterium SG7u.132]WPO38063.1 pectate lyase [Flammeovirgaceae bacterium SG7u.111]
MKMTSHQIIKTSISLFVIAFTLLSSSCQKKEDAPEAAAAKAETKEKWGKSYLRKNPEWYGTEEARELADKLLLYQSSLGAWPKNTDFADKLPSGEELEKIKTGKSANTIDNGATSTPMIFLAKMAQATEEEKYKAAFTHGLDYLLAAQYPNGGWPQFYPLRKKGYYSEITYNDNAMMNVMFLLQDIAEGKAPYGFVAIEKKNAAIAAVKKGIDCILQTQIKVDGTLTAWCAQHDENTFEPVWARNFEPPSISGAESVTIVKFLLTIDNPSPKMIAAIDAAVQWFEKSKITGLKYERGLDSNGEKDGWIEEDPNAAPLLARFYEIESNRPIFVGRDKVTHYALKEIEQERRGGYSYYGRWPEKLVEKDYPKWAEKYKI